MKVVIISAVWCPSCLIMLGRYHELQNKYPNIQFIEYDYDNDKQVVAEHKVWKTLPVFIIYKNNEEVARFIGEKSIKEISLKIESFIDD